jgi:hypothetical protein
MKTLVQKVFGNTINGDGDALKAFPNSRLQEVSRELKKKLELKRAAEMTDDQKIAIALAALRSKPKNTLPRSGR